MNSELSFNTSSADAQLNGNSAPPARKRKHKAKGDQGNYDSYSQRQKLQKLVHDYILNHYEMFSVFRLGNDDLKVGRDKRKYVDNRDLDANEQLFKEMKTEFEAQAHFSIGSEFSQDSFDFDENDEHDQTKKAYKMNENEQQQNIIQDEKASCPDTVNQQEGMTINESRVHAATLMAESLNGIAAETPNSYLSDRFHPCQQIASTLRRLRKLTLGDACEYMTDADTNMKMLRNLIEREKDGKELIELFANTLQFPFIEIIQDRGIRTHLKRKFGHQHEKDLYDSLKSNPYNQTIMMRRLRGYEESIKWNRDCSGMIFMVPAVKPINLRYLNLSSCTKMHVLTCFGYGFDNLKAVMVNKESVQWNTRLTKDVSYFDPNRCLNLNKPAAFVTPDCIVLCSKSELVQDSIETLSNSGSSTAIKIEHFERIQPSKWEGLVLGYHLGYVSEGCINENTEPIKLNPWERSTHVLGIPKLEIPSQIHSLTLRSLWYRTQRLNQEWENECSRETLIDPPEELNSFVDWHRANEEKHPEYESVRLEKNQVVDFVDKKDSRHNFPL